MKFTTSAVLLAALALSTPLVLAQTGHGSHAATTTKAATAAPDLTKLSGRAFDRAYLSMMIGHHEGAVDMSRAVLGRVKDAQVKKWASAVIADQTREINTMTSWLKELGGLHEGARDAMTADMKGMVAPLKSARNADVAFVKGMVPHHASALDMANLALQRSSDLRVLKLSRDIIKAQADEMFAFRTWLARSGS